MIKDNINNINAYINLDKKLYDGLKYLQKTDFTKLDDGKIDISNTTYINIQSYTTKSSANYEAHRKYIDIQYMIEGSENIGVIDLSKCKTVITYDEEKDIEFLEGCDNFINLSTGEFIILYPNDAHKPSISIDTMSPATVRKAVIKVMI